MDKKLVELLFRYLIIRKQLRNDLFFLAHILGYDLVVKMRTSHHEAILDKIRTEQLNFFIIELPRGTYKTTVFTILDTIQDVLNDPNTRQLICHFAGQLARAMLDEIANHFISNENLRFVFPDICPSNTKRPETGDWTSDSITLKRSKHFKESTIHALGSDQAMASYHFDRIRFDDLVVEQSTTTTDQIAKADAFLQKSYSLLNNHNVNRKLSIVGTQWAPDDTMVKLEKGTILAPDGEKYELFKIPDYNEDAEGNKVANFPDILSLETLKGLEKSQGLVVYSAFYRLNSTEVLGALWTRQNISWYTEIPNDRKFTMVGSLDPSISDKEIKDSCDTAVGVVGLDQFNELWLLEYKLSKGLATVYDDMFSMYHTWKHATRIVEKQSTGIKVKESIGDFRYFVLETTLFQKLVAKEFRLQMQERGIWIPVRENDPHKDKMKRIMELDSVIRSRAFHLKVGMNDAESQIIRFGRPNTKVDILDMVAQAYTSLQLKSRNSKTTRNTINKEYHDMWNIANIV